MPTPDFCGRAATPRPALAASAEPAAQRKSTGVEPPRTACSTRDLGQARLQTVRESEGLSSVDQMWRSARAAIVAVLVAAAALGWTLGCRSAGDARAGPGRPDPRRHRSRAIRSARYYAEILRAEGLNEFAVDEQGEPQRRRRWPATRSSCWPQTSLTDAQAALLDGWVAGGGNLIAMRPDAQLAGLLGPGRRHRRTSRDGYIKIDTGSPPGAGITGADDAVPRHRGPLVGPAAPRRSRRSTRTPTPPPRPRP